MDLRGASTFFAKGAEIATPSEHHWGMSPEELNQRRNLLFWLWKKENEAPPKDQPLLLRAEWRVGRF